MELITQSRRSLRRNKLATVACFSDLEKNNYRQVMFIVSLLETRAAARAMRDEQEQLQAEQPATAPVVEEPANTPLEEETAAQTEIVEAEQAENQ